jgi:predicted 3-demethylubiquinone-9 3-methyltransferase (glyoxalase superfamily)
MKFNSKIVPCLWMDDTAEEAVKFYTGIFPDSRITQVDHYPDTGKEIHGHDAGKVLTISFELAGCEFTALNGGPHFKFNEAISLQILVDSQDELDHYWDKLGQGGDPAARQCGWLKDRYGLSWQVVPTSMIRMLSSPDKAAMQRAFAAMLEMQKLDIAALERAFQGETP